MCLAGLHPVAGGVIGSYCQSTLSAVFAVFSALLFLFTRTDLTSYCPSSLAPLFSLTVYTYLLVAAGETTLSSTRITSLASFTGTLTAAVMGVVARYADLLLRLRPLKTDSLLPTATSGASSPSSSSVSAWRCSLSVRFSCSLFLSSRR
jgi:hypothetical protein